MTDSKPNDVVHNQAESQFQLKLGEVMGVLHYKILDNVIQMLSVEVPIAHRNQGHAAEITKAALEFAKSCNLEVEPHCPYVKSFLRKNPEYSSLVVADSAKE